MSTVLIAEDEESLLEVLCEAVSNLGHEVLRASDGEDALLLARARPPDLVITDHMMPRRSGMDLVDALRCEPRLAGVPTIVISAVRPKGVERAGRFLAKPVALIDFERAVDEALGGTGAARGAPPVRAQTAAAASTRALEETLQWVAHELKTPLSAAQLGAQLLRKRLGDDAGAREREAIDMILRQLARMNVFVSSVLDAAQLREGRLILDRRPFDVAGWLGEVVNDWRVLRPGFEFSLVVAPEEPVVVRGDAVRLRQVVDNLISNAVKHGAPPERLEVRLELGPGVAQVRVRDHGAGIPAADLPRIFEKFQRAPGTSAAGHGLGLAIASSLARLHGGALSVESALGEGSTFTLTLPRT